MLGILHDTLKFWVILQNIGGSWRCRAQLRVLKLFNLRGGENTHNDPANLDYITRFGEILYINDLLFIRKYPSINFVSTFLNFNLKALFLKSNLPTKMHILPTWQWRDICGAIDSISISEPMEILDCANRTLHPLLIPNLEPIAANAALLIF
jgi:hypothetical protein